MTASSALRRRATPLLTALTLVACATPQQALSPTPEFAPVFPVAARAQSAPTGAIYNGQQSDNWFGRGRWRSFAVGDVITVLLNEETQAGRQISADIKRNASNDVLPSGLIPKVEGLSSALKGINLNEANIESVGKGQADQRASLSGAVSVTVVEVLNNGNLIVRGEKQLALTEGSEVIQVSGIIRPEDISPNNTVQSRRLANAQIAYRGTGDMASASKPGWGTSLLFKLWPF